MRFAIVLLMVLSALPQAADAAIVFTLTPPTSTIDQGTPAIFEVSVRSTLAGGEAVDALEANIVSAAGVFSAGTTFLLNNAPVDLSVPREAFVSNFLAGGFILGQSDTLFARLTLNTAAIAPGTYSVQFENGSVAANSPTLAALPVQVGGPISFTITAVPEPSSMMLVGTVSCLFALRRRKR